MLVIIKGEILPDELDAIKKDIETNLDAPPESFGQRLFVLASYGGDSEEAMRIGRYIRQIKGTTMVPETGKCYSACIFVLAGGVERIMDGPVAINWPDYAIGTTSPGQSNRLDGLSLVTDFFDEMNVPAALAEEMYMIPPSELKLLSDEERIQYFSR